MSEKTFALVVATSFLVAAGCVSVERIELSKEEAQLLSCEELQQVLVDAGAMADDAAAKQGVTVTNASAAVFVPFGLQVNQLRAKNAENTNKQAIEVLYREWDRKGCSAAIYEANKASRSDHPNNTTGDLSEP